MRFIRIFIGLFLLSFPIFAESESFHTIHLSFPLETRTLKTSDSHSRKYFDFDKSCKANYFGAFANWNRLSFKESGFSFLFGLEAGFTAANIPDVSSDFFIGGILNTFGGKFGFGYAPLRNGKYILAFHGFSELKGFFLDYGTKYKVANISDDLSYTIQEFSFISGFDCVFIAKLSEKITLLTGLDISTIVLGFGSLDVTRSGSTDDSEEISYTNFFNGINVCPRLGLCFGF